VRGEWCRDCNAASTPRSRFGETAGAVRAPPPLWEFFAVDPTRNAIVSLLASRPDQPRKALYQHSFPYSQRWGYLHDRDTPIIHFDEMDIRRLHRDGVLKFLGDDRGRRCAVLTDTATGGHVGARASRPTKQRAGRLSRARKKPRPPSLTRVSGCSIGMSNRTGSRVSLHVPKLGDITVAALLRQIDFFMLHFD
jgi:hypothetical protein